MNKRRRIAGNTGFDGNSLVRHCRGAGPCTHKFPSGIGQRTDESYLRIFFQRQYIMVVFQKHDGLPGGFQGQRTVFFPVYRLAAETKIRILKKSELIFGFKNAAACHIYVGLCKQPFFKTVIQVLQHAFRHHIHIKTRLQCPCRHLCKRTKSVFRQFSDRCIVADCEAVKSPFSTEDISQKPFIGSGRHSIDVIE